MKSTKAIAISLILAATTLKSLNAISQQKQTESGIVCLPINDVALIAQNNEIGKRAIKKLPLLQEKISALDSIVSLQKIRLTLKQATLDSVLFTATENENKYKQVIENDRQIKNSYESGILLITNDLNNTKKQLKRSRLHTIIAASAVILFSSLILLLK